MRIIRTSNFLACQPVAPNQTQSGCGIIFVMLQCFRIKFNIYNGNRDTHLRCWDVVLLIGICQEGLGETFSSKHFLVFQMVQEYCKFLGVYIRVRTIHPTHDLIQFNTVLM